MAALTTAHDYQRLVLEDILEWYKSIHVPSGIPGFERLRPLMQEARVLVDTHHEQTAKAEKKIRERKSDEENGLAGAPA